MKTMDFKGRPYVTVNERIKYFRENYADFALTSELISNVDGVAIFKASVLDSAEMVRATGWAYEKEGDSFINKTSYIENCETSAWGRALGNFGIGIDASVASYDEVANTVNNQNEQPVDIDRSSFGKLDYSLMIQGLEECQDLEQLKTVFAKVYKGVGNDKQGQAILTAKKDEMKILLQASRA